MRFMPMLVACSIILAGGAAMADDVHWGPFKDDGCQAAHAKQFSSILWGVPWGQSWEQTCWSTPGLEGRLPNRCVNDGLHEWGEWDVEDDTCPP